MLRGCLLALVLCGVAAAPAQATVYAVAPADRDGPEETFQTNEALWAVGTANPMEGTNQLCVVEESAGASGDCVQDGLWGQPNAIATTGTYLQPISSAGLPTGRYRILADNGDDGQDIISQPFTVVACTEADCSTAIADAELQQWKDAAQQSLSGPAAACLAATAYTKSFRSVVGGALTGDGRQFVLAQLRDGTGAGLEFDLPVSSGAGAVNLLQHVSCGAWLAYSDIVSDPPDPDFRKLTAAAVRDLPAVYDAQADAAGEALELLRANAVAQRIASERYQGAVVGDDAGWPAVQASVLAETGFAMGKGMRRAVAPLRAFAAQLDADPEIAAATPAQVAVARDVHDRIRTLGFTQGEQDELAGLGLTPDDIAQLRVDMGAPLPAGTGGVHPADALRAQATSLEAASCHAPGSSCAFDDFARFAGAVAGNAEVPPTLEVGAVTLLEGDRGVNHVHLPLRLSHPPSGPVTAIVAPAGDGELPPGVALNGTTALQFDRDRRRAVTGLTVVNDDVLGPQRTAELELTVTGPAAPPGPVSVPVADDDATPGPRSGSRGRLAFSAGSLANPGIYLTERTGSDVHRVSDGEPGSQLQVIDWSADGRHMLLYRLSFTATDDAANGRPHYLLPVGPDGRPTGPKVRVTPEGTGLYDGASLSRNGRRLLMSRATGLTWELVMQRITADGTPEGPLVVLAEDPQLAELSFAYGASWSPDGSRAAVHACGPGYKACGIYVVEIDAAGDVTAAPRALSLVPDGRGQSLTDPSWSPDGRFVAYSAYRPDASPKFAVERIPVTASGVATGPRAVMAGWQSELPARWSADSRAIALSLVEHPLSDSAVRSAVVVELDAEARPVGAPTLVAPLEPTPSFMAWGPPVRDTSAPASALAASPAPNAAGWNAGTVELRLTAVDDPGGDGVATVRYDLARGDGVPGSEVVTPGASATVTLADEGVHRVRYRAIDAAGNAEARRELVVRIDRTAPAIDVGSPAPGAAHPIGAAVDAAFTCTDAASGVARCTGTTPSGGRLDTSAAGEQVLRVEAADLAGNVATTTRGWRVLAPVTVEAPPAAPAASTAAPATKPPAAPPAAATLPSNRRCVSRRLFRIRLARPSGDPLVRGEVRLGSRRVRTLRGRALTAPVDLRGLPSGRFVVTVTVVTKKGRKLTTRRAYRTCVSRR